MSIIQFIATIFVAFIGGCFGTTFIEVYKIRLQTYNSFVNAFASCTERVGIVGDKDGIEKCARYMEYAKQEAAMLIHGTEAIVCFIEQLRKDANLEDERFVFLAASIREEYTNKIDLEKIFSMTNYRKLCEIARKDIRSLEFKFHII